MHAWFASSSSMPEIIRRMAHDCSLFAALRPPCIKKGTPFCSLKCVLSSIQNNQTCSFLYEVTQRRALWLAVARRMSHSHGLLSTSFPFQKMTLDELEHLALSPARMENLIAAASKVPSDRDAEVRPVQTRCMSLCRSRLGNELDMEVDDLHLLPGGRFLLTLHPGDGIYLWDLGHNAVAPPRTCPLASLHFASRVVNLEMDPPMPTTDRHGIRVVCHWSE